MTKLSRGCSCKQIHCLLETLVDYSLSGISSGIGSNEKHGKTLTVVLNAAKSVKVFPLNVFLYMVSILLWLATVHHPVLPLQENFTEISHLCDL